MFNNMVYIYTCIIVEIIIYAGVFPRSVPGRTLSIVFKIIRVDVKACCTEI